jgi:16S rRNA (guanine(966)-N(2))-methyltransferase RsmD
MMPPEGYNSANNHERRVSVRIRIIAGSAKGLLIKVPQGKNVRPTTDRVREALFNMLAPRIEGSRFLDLFAGTGANGLEALSRGAAECLFVEAHGPTLSLIAENAEALSLSSKAHRQCLDLTKGLARISGADAGYDIIFADPPYDFKDYLLILEQLAEGGLVRPSGTIVIEHSVRVDLPEEVDALKQVRTCRYGETALTFFA